MKILLTVALMATATISMAQNWGNWINVGSGIQVSFKFGKEPCTFANTRARLRNGSSVTYKEVRVSFNTNCDGDSPAAVSAYDFAPEEMKESAGDFYSTYLRVSNIRLTKLITGQNKNLVSGGSGSSPRTGNLGGSVSLDGDNVVNPTNRQNDQYTLQKARDQQALTQQLSQQRQAAQTQRTQQEQQRLENQRLQNQRQQEEADRQKQELVLQQQAAQERYNQQIAAIEQERIQREKTIDAVGELAQQLMSVEVDGLEKSDNLFLFEGGINRLTSPWIVSGLTKSLGKSPLAWRIDITMLNKKGLSLNLSFSGLKQENDHFLLSAIANNGNLTLYKGLMTGNLFCTQLSAGKDIRSSNNRFHLYLGPNLNLNTVMEHSFTYDNGSSDYQEATIKDSYWGYGFQFRLRYFLGEKIALTTGWEYNTFFARPAVLVPYKTHGYGSYSAGLGIRF